MSEATIVVHVDTTEATSRLAQLQRDIDTTFDRYPSPRMIEWDLLTKLIADLDRVDIKNGPFDRDDYTFDVEAWLRSWLEKYR